MIRELMALGFTLAAGLNAADSTRGARLFETLACVQCHGVNGKGAAIGPDLGKLVDRNFTPASLAATMWNHAPAMWASMRDRDIRAGNLDEQAAGDLFAYFYATRFFEKPGDAGRGKRLFAERGCASCHGLNSVSQWQVLADPVNLAEAMWNHRARMMDVASASNMPWPDMTAQDLGDVLVYLRHLPSAPSKPAVFRIGAGSDGEAVFKAKGCEGCHRSGSALASRIKGQTLTEIAASMWNHAPKMAAAGAKLTRLEADEMRELLSYLWAEQFFRSAGNPAAGRRVFAAKRCVSCHDGAPGGTPVSGSTMVSALWHHGPRMLDQMKAKGIAWPRFEGSQMSDLIAFLNSAKRSSP